MDTKYYLIAGVIVLVFLLGNFTQKSYNLFSTMEVKENCENWIARVNMDGQTNKGTFPLCLKSSISEKWITEINESDNGCLITYKSGCNPEGLSCISPEFHECEDGRMVKWCSCVSNEYSCIPSPETQCGGGN